MEHPTGVTVEIVGLEEGSSGRSCERHAVCGSVVENNTVVRFRRMQVLDEEDDVEEAAIAAFWISDGIDSCRVGYLPRHCLKHWKQYEGKLAQVIDLYKDSDSPSKRRKNHRNLGCCLAVMIDAVRSSPPRTPKTKKRARQEDTAAAKDDAVPEEEGKEG
jgi:hypothetical protein